MKISKTVSLKTLKKVLLLTCLTASACVSCKTTAPKDFPEVPVITLKESIIEQKFCDSQGQNCEVKSVCREYAQDEKEKWYFLKDHEIKFCHGILGVNGKEFVEIKDFIRKAKLWLDKNFSSFFETE